MNKTKPSSYRALLEDGKQALYDASDTPRIDAEVLLQHVIKRPLSWLIAYGDNPADAEHSKHFYQLIAHRQQGHPIAYLTGERDFWSLSLEVNEHVLIPRPDTETLVEAALDCLASMEPAENTRSLLDLGTGSGAIALSLAKETPKADVTAIDFSAQALEVATQNAERNNISNVTFIQSSWYDKLDGALQFDLIASNPPYIAPNDPHLEQGDLRYEPSSALVAPERGLADLDIIISTAPRFLKQGAWLIVEHGFDQAQEVAQLFDNAGFREVSLQKDLNQLPRCTLGKWIS